MGHMFSKLTSSIWGACKLPHSVIWGLVIWGACLENSPPQ